MKSADGLTTGIGHSRPPEEQRRWLGTRSLCMDDHGGRTSTTSSLDTTFRRSRGFDRLTNARRPIGDGPVKNHARGLEPPRNHFTVRGMHAPLSQLCHPRARRKAPRSDHREGEGARRPWLAHGSTFRSNVQPGLFGHHRQFGSVLSARQVCPTPGVKLRGPEGAQRLRATSA